MKKIYLILFLFAFVILGTGCGQDDPTRPEAEPEAAAKSAQCRTRTATLVPGEYYSMFFADETGNYSEFSRVNTRNGRADLVMSLQTPVGGDGEVSFGWATFGFAFDVDGAMYTTQNLLAFDPAEVRTQFARIDSGTGEVVPYGPIMNFNTGGGDIDACGNYFVCGFQVDALGYIFGNDSLWRVDKVTGEFSEVGSTGHTNWMDLAFDSRGTLWGTFDNELYVIDTETGASTFVTAISGVPDAGPPHFMEVMSIAFGKHDVLYGSGLTVHYDHPDGSPVMRIDAGTGATTLLGYSHTTYANHGGDIMPAKVRVAHRQPGGGFKCIEVSMQALPAHLAHGDYVPGSAGHDCDCP